MSTALLLLALLSVAIITIRAVRMDGYGTSAPPPTYEHSSNTRQPVPRLLP